MKKITIIFLVLLSLTLSSSLNSATSRPHIYDVIIIGAGAAGLGAAQNLIHDNKDILVLESRDRIGGRVMTVNEWNGPIDLGASWIHGTENNPLTAIAAQSCTNTIPTNYNDNIPSDSFKDMQVFDPDGTPLKPHEIDKIRQQAEEFIDYLHEYGKNHTVFLTLFNEFARKHHIKGLARTRLYSAVRLMYTHEYGADLEALTLQNELDIQVSVSGSNVLLQEGYITLFNTLAKNIPIHFNQIVTEVEYQQSGVTVKTDTAAYQAKYLIITVPVGVLKAEKIKFTPTLPDWKQSAINNLQMGYYNKTYLLFDHAFWGENAPEILEYIPSWEKRDTSIEVMNMYKFFKKPILLVFAAGDDALNKENLSDSENIAEIMETLRKMYGPNIPEPSGYLMTRWGKDPFALGSYSYLPIGSTINDIRLLAEPVDDRLFFAGEATSITDPATVHGAYSTGVKTAETIISLLNTVQSMPSEK